MIDFVFESIHPINFNVDDIRNWILSVIKKENKIAGDICFIFCSDDYLLEINRKYLKHDYYTDVISFDYSGQEIVSGDIFISIERVMENAVEFSEIFEKETLRVIIHGVLHLIGFKDKSKRDKKEMTEKENTYLQLFEDVEGI